MTFPRYSSVWVDYPPWADPRPASHREAGHKLATEAAARLRILRQSLGFVTAAAFARAIGYTPAKYQKYERRLPIQPMPVIRLVRAIHPITFVSLDWLFCGDLKREPPSVRKDRLKLVG